MSRNKVIVYMAWLGRILWIIASCFGYSKAWLTRWRTTEQLPLLAETLSLSPIRSFYKAFDDTVIQDRIQLANSVCCNATDMPFLRATEFKSPSDHTDYFIQQVASSNGGWAVIEIDDKPAILKDMWSCIDTLFTQHSNDITFREQILSLNKHSGGYKYFELALANGSFQELTEAIGEERAVKARAAFEYIAELAASFCRLVGNHDIKQHLLHNSPKEMYSGSIQRYARYSQSGSEENLRSHGDWSFATVVPVSAIPGLQVFDGKHWICPEALLEERNESFFVVIMAGKWLEILTQGRIPATIHRVISHDTGRYSAPFFLRPSLSVLEAAELIPEVNDDSDGLITVSEFLTSFR